jgi:hypothetical protein
VSAKPALVIRLGSRDGDHRSDADQGERPEADDRYRVHKTLHEQHDRSDVQSREVAQVPDDRTIGCLQVRSASMILLNS